MAATVEESVNGDKLQRWQRGLAKYHPGRKVIFLGNFHQRDDAAINPETGVKGEYKVNLLKMDSPARCFNGWPA